MSKARQRERARQRKQAHRQGKSVTVRAGGELPLREFQRSAWRDLPEVKRQRIEQFDNFAGLRHAIRHLAKRDNEWAGIPMPLDDQQLVVEPKYPNAEGLMKIGKRAAEMEARPTPEEHGCKIRGSFFSTHRKVQIVIWQEADGRIAWGAGSSPHHATELLNTIGASWAWGIEQEGMAVRTLTGLLRHNQFKQYMLTGMFLESSKRSGITYIFRRLRPTIALSMRGDVVRIIAALCLHPIAYYAHSYAGAMCPTDDVIAHLMLMRGDEHLFWRRANQHRPGDPLAGIG